MPQQGRELIGGTLRVHLAKCANLETGRPLLPVAVGGAWWERNRFPPNTCVIHWQRNSCDKIAMVDFVVGKE